MNKAMYMTRLGSLLGNLSQTEKDEALQYYNDYFEDAGAENEEEVISQLGTPEKLAENIIRDLSGNGYDGLYDEAVRRKPEHSVVTYGENLTKEANPQEASILIRGVVPMQGEGQGGFNAHAMANETIARAGGISSNNSGNYQNGGATNQSNVETPYGEKKKGNGPMIALLILTSPIWASLLLVGCVLLFALLIAWFAIIIAVGAVTLALIISAISLFVSGAMVMGISWPVGLAVIGIGCIITSIDLLFLMLLVALTGIVTPAIFRGIGAMFRTSK